MKRINFNNHKHGLRQRQTQGRQFDVIFSSAYANGYFRWYKKRGGGWKSVSEEVEQLDELSAKKLEQYVKEGADNVDDRRIDQAHCEQDNDIFTPARNSGEDEKIEKTCEFIQRL